MKLVKRVVLVNFIFFSITACGTVPMRINSVPQGKTTEQTQLDDIQCSQASKVTGPWVYGLGNAIMNEMAKERYTKCMESKGYKVSPQ